MDSKKILSLIKRNEGLKLDFKQKLLLEYESGKKELAKDVCAIANSRGGRGYIVVGVEDKTKNIIGLMENELFSEEQIQQIITSRCEPPIPISVDICDFQGKKIGIITIYDGGQKPYQVRETGAFYTRRGSTTDTMRKQELIEAFQENLDFSMETCPIIKSDINLLNMKLVEKYFSKKGITVTEENKIFLLESTNIIHIDKETGIEKCTLGGLLVFSDYNSICVPQNMIRIVNKDTKDSYHVNIIQGNLLSMIDRVEKFFKEVLPKAYPIDALIEGVNNAILYREYSSINRSIEITISPNSVIINSPGQMIEDNVRGQKINYNKKNMWLYEKLITLDDCNRFLNNGRGFKRMRNAFQGKTKFINSKSEDAFKVLLPGVKFYK